MTEANEKPLLDAFRYEAARLGDEFARASKLGSGTSQEVADHRENAFRSLIKRFWPAPYHVAKGQVLGVTGAKSASLDCVVLSPAHPNIVDREGKFSLILADGVELVADAKGRLDGAELTRFLTQARSVKQVKRSRSAIILNRDPARTEASLHIPTFAYCHESALSAASVAAQIVDWVTKNDVPPNERPDVIAIHDVGIFIDNSNFASPGRRLLGDAAPAGIFWIDTGPLTLGQFIVLMNLGVGSQPTMQESVLLRYGTMPGKAQHLHEY